MLLKKKYLNEWLLLAKDRNLPDALRARSAYIYSFLTGKKLKLKLNLPQPPAFYHGNIPFSDDKLVQYCGLRNGINTMRFSQFKETGVF